ncbi:hypothetical protein T4B_183 [Trichinella pseudospiralis]|uniref:Uncharacterized protein n=1 Tax=Trichinella pseudospiralis TaxID=6337 RepID=A0A0V1GLM9_TRIPS|nr:hypothetical protein T4B_183 [Trichinella pseudospiralis]
MVSIPTNIAEINVFVKLLQYLEYSKKIRKLLAITKFEWCNKKRCISGASVSRETQIHSDAIGWHTVCHFTMKCRNRETSLKKTL